MKPVTTTAKKCCLLYLFFLLHDNIVDLPEIEFLDIKYNKRLEFFAPCYSQSSLLADFKENHTLLWFTKPFKKSAKQENQSLFMNSLRRIMFMPKTSTKNAVQEFYLSTYMKLCIRAFVSRAETAGESWLGSVSPWRGGAASVTKFFYVVKL